MINRLAPVSTKTNALSEATRPSRRRHAVWMFVLVWTLFVGLALWWLLRGNAGPTVWIVHDADSVQRTAGERFHGWFKADLGFERIYPWLLLGPYIALVASYFPLERGRLRLNLPLNLATCAAFIAASQAITSHTRTTVANVTIIKSDPAQIGRETSTVDVRISRSSGLPGGKEYRLMAKTPDAAEAGLTNLFDRLPPGLRPPPPPGWPKLTLWSSLLDLVAYGAIAGLAHSVHFYRRFREREHRAVLLESNLANARLGVLRAQLQPHFLFNSLNAIATLLRRDPRQAEATLMSLSELLRLALSQSEKQEITLREEMNFVEHYLEIQRTRFGDKLKIELNIQPTALDCLVPALLLQPLVENAIRHGIEPTDRDGLVRLAAHRHDGALELVVEDDGVGLTNSGKDLDGESKPAGGSKTGAGIGLANLRARLEMLYGANQSLELIAAERGVTVRIKIPCRTATAFEHCGGANPAAASS